MRYALLLTLAAWLSPSHAAITLQGKGNPARPTVATTYSVVTLPRGTDYLRIRPPTGITVYFATGCSDGDTAPGSHYETIAAETTTVRAVHSLGVVCLAASSSSAVEITPLEAGR